MVLYPVVQKKAQVELDTVLLGGHLPTTEIKQSLPYVTAVLLEVFRWRPPAPIGMLFTPAAFNIKMV
jgi:cytochrome P450